MRNFIIIRKISNRKIDLYNKADAMLPYHENFVYTISLVQRKLVYQFTISVANG